ncbi:MAG TPA: NADP-dependent oxidoreductase [Candidatus Obscuribacterales bacterium]
MNKVASLRNQQWIYVKRPTGRVSEENYELVETELSGKLSANEVIIRAEYISVDPYMRIQQAERNTYDPPHPLGIVQRGGVIGHVVDSESHQFKPGDWVLAYSGWQMYAKCHAGELQRLDPQLINPISTALGVLGMPGRTAWFGLMEAGKPKPGETVVVSGAAGAVGSLVAQFAKRAGCRVFGIAGGAKKCQFLKKRLGLDGAIDYRQFHDWQPFSDAIAEITGGVDIYFDNVGGMVTDAVMPNIKRRARVVICGAISQYEGELDKPDLAPRFLQHLIFQRATIQGILARDYTNRMDEMLNIVGPWVRNKEILFEETIIDGFEKLPEALNSLFEGKNLGKLLVRV